MALVSVCIVLVLTSFTVFGRTGGYDAEIFTPKKRSQLDTAMAMTRINRCTTVAGAIDTYAKALAYVEEHGVMAYGCYIVGSPQALLELMEREDVLMVYPTEGWLNI